MFSIRSKRPRAALVGALMLALALPACANSSGIRSLSADEAALREKSGAMAGTVVEGAVIGAVTGALLGAVFGNGAKSAAIGAGVGAVAGGAGGYWISKQQESFASEEARVDSMIADVREENRKLEDYAITARRVIAADQTRLVQLERQIADQTTTREEAELEVLAIRENIEVIQKTTASLRTKKDEFAYAAENARYENAANAQAMNFEIAQLEQQIAQLESELDALNGALEVFVVG